MIHNGGLPWWLSGKESACQRTRHKRHVFDAWVGSHQSSGEGNDDPFQYSCLTIPWIEKPGGLQSTGVPKESDTI